MSLVEDRITLHETAPAEQAASARRTLAQRLAQRNRLRAERAERLARLHERPGDGVGPQAAAADDDGAALEDFLRALTGGLRSEAPAVLPPPGAVLPFQRPAVDTPPEASAAPTPAPPAAAAAAPAAAKAPDLDRLPGAGPGLVWALERAGLRCLADLAPLAPEDLAARLGPLGRLVPAASWIAAARRAVAEVSAA